jgi:hypothetical protein
MEWANSGQVQKGLSTSPAERFPPAFTFQTARRNNMRTTKRSVRAHRDRNGMIVYRLLRGEKKPRTIRRFGYGTLHKIWVEIHDYGNNSTAMTVTGASSVKEAIAQWCS